MDANNRLAAWRDDWFRHPEWWFSGIPELDAVIAARHGDLLDYNTLEWFDREAPSLHTKVAAILVHDQLARHVFRGQAAGHILAYHNRLACRMALDVIAGIGEDGSDSLTCNELCFVLLPLRHTGQKQLAVRAAQMGWKRLLTEAKDSQGYCAMKRFLTATYKRFPMEEDASTVLIDAASPNNRSNWFPIPAEALPALDEGCVITGGSAACRGHGHRDSQATVTDAIDAALQGSTHVIVSLSGGVDSMACVHALQRGTRKGGPMMAAVHINYCNRQHSDAEEAFVRHYCASRGIPLYVRRVTEIHRPTCMAHGMRDVYEDYTRDVRYATYAFAWRHAFGENSQGLGPVTVILGHNRCDAFENILTNVAYRTHYDNLEGMSVLSVHGGMRVLRPLLGVDKDAIKAYAAWHGLPHVRNSTPPWSQRGKIRAHVVPALDAWDARLVSGMFALSDVMKDLAGCVRDCVESMARHNVTVCTDTGRTKLTFQDGERIPTSVHVWKVFLESVARIRTSNKSLKNFIEHLERFRDERAVILNKSSAARFRLCHETHQRTIEFWVG